MATFIKLLLLILVIAMVAVFFIDGPDGEPLMTLDKLQQPDALSSLQETVGEITGSGQDAAEKQPTADNKAKVYSWKDEQGNLHYSNVPPADQANVQTVKVDPHVNVIKLDKDDPESVSRLPIPAPDEESDVQNTKPGMMRTYTPPAGQ